MAVEYLDRDHAALGPSTQLLREAERALLEQALGTATRSRIEFDSERLRALLGEDSFNALFSEGGVRVGPGRYDVHEAELDPERAALLLELLAPAEPGDSESPRNYIRSIRLLGDGGETLLRGGDHLTFILFDLPPAQRRAVGERFRELGLAEDAVQPVEVDFDRLEP